MKKKCLYVAIILFGIFSISEYTYAQEIEATWELPTDDLGNVSDAFQENFFEALKQKAIENYELAIEALKKAEIAAKKNPRNVAVVFFEMGKNLTELEKYDEAEEYFKKVMETEENQWDVMEALYDLYYVKKDYDSAIPLVEKLIEKDDDYKEDLANLYTRTQQFDKALELLDELDRTRGESDYRDSLRTQIYHMTGNASKQIERLSSKIDANPNNEKDYLHLIFLYSEEGNTQKAYEMALQLLKSHPGSQLAHLALYKFYLEEENIQEAMKSMLVVFRSPEIDEESKYRVLGDFVSFVHKNPNHEEDLERVVSVFSSENSGKVYEKIGDYYLVKERKEEALKFYEKGVVDDQDNYSLVKNTLLLQIDFKKYEAAEELSAIALEIFPSQPLLYLLNGVANNGLKRTDIAIESLETGLDYLLEDQKMELDFYEQLVVAYTERGDIKSAEGFRNKAKQIKGSN